MRPPSQFKSPFASTQLIIAFALLALLLIGPLTPGVDAMVVSEKRTVMGTDIELTISIDKNDQAKAQKAFDAVEAEFKRIESEMSEWREDTLVSLVNRNAGIAPVKVTDELFMLISVAKEVALLTDGAFDPTWAAMRHLWDFRVGTERVPTKEEVKEVLPLIDFRQIELDQKALTVKLKREGMGIGLGGIAKGYAVDRAAEILARMNIENAIIKAGGDIRVQGERGSGERWKVSIRHPRENGKLATLPLTNISISTSGDYERFFIKEDTLYHHIIDPNTGYPARKCQSVTILAPDTMTSDALSTSVFVLGPAKGLALVEKLGGVEAIIVDSSGAVLTSKGIELQ